MSLYCSFWPRDFQKALSFFESRTFISLFSFRSIFVTQVSEVRIHGDVSELTYDALV